MAGAAEEGAMNKKIEKIRSQLPSEVIPFLLVFSRLE
jgi:hypothetical protein